jgi:hypothetical protein
MTGGIPSDINDSALASAPLPNRASTEQACLWLAGQTGTPWTLARLLEHGLTPYVWLDYSDTYAALFFDGVTGYPAPIFFVDDIARLAAGSNDVLIRHTRSSDTITAKIPGDGMRLPLAALLFLQRDVARLAEAILHPPEPVPEPAPPSVPPDLLKGLGRDDIIEVFGRLAQTARLDLAQALMGAVGIFGDDGARTRKNSRAGKNSHLWNPVTLAFGLHDVHRVPMSHLKKAFATQPLLRPWRHAWLESLALLGE